MLSASLRLRPSRPAENEPWPTVTSEPGPRPGGKRNDARDIVGAMAQWHKARDLQDAIRLASALKDQGSDDWFRGQLQNWPLKSSFVRLGRTKSKRVSKGPDGSSVGRSQLRGWRRWCKMWMRFALSPSTMAFQRIASILRPVLKSRDSSLLTTRTRGR